MSTSRHKPSLPNVQRPDNSHARLGEWDLVDVLAFTGHELRNRIAVLHLAANRLHCELGDTLNQRQEKAVRAVDESIYSIESVAEKYLNLARASDPNYRVKKAPVDPVRDIIDRWMKLNGALLAKTRQTVSVESAHKGILIWADPEMLYSVFDNLLGNATKYGSEGGQIIIRILEKGSSVSLRVWNSGPGIPVERLETIFRRFSREDTKASASGYGIGLYLARLIVEAHGGRIWADSRQGSWASFTFTLPQRQF